MPANEIIPVLNDVSEQIDRLEVALTQLDAACLADGTAKNADLANARTTAVHIAARLTKAASKVLLLHRRLDNFGSGLAVSARYGKKDSQ